MLTNNPQGFDPELGILKSDHPSHLVLSEPSGKFNITRFCCCPLSLIMASPPVIHIPRRVRQSEKVNDAYSQALDEHGPVIAVPQHGRNEYVIDHRYAPEVPHRHQESRLRESHPDGRRGTESSRRRQDPGLIPRYLLPHSAYHRSRYGCHDPGTRTFPSGSRPLRRHGRCNGKHERHAREHARVDLVPLIFRIPHRPPRRHLYYHPLFLFPHRALALENSTAAPGQRPCRAPRPVRSLSDMLLVKRYHGKSGFRALTGFAWCVILCVGMIFASIHQTAIAAFWILVKLA